MFATLLLATFLVVPQTKVSSHMDTLLEELTRRDLASRITTHDDPVIRRALAILGQPLNPVQVVSRGELEDIYRESAPERVRNTSDERRLWGVAAFRRPNDAEGHDPAIYVNRDHSQYRRATDGKDALANLIMAASLAHEQTHNTERGNEGERAARRIEADFLRSRLDTVPGSQKRDAERWLYMIEKMAANDPLRVKR